MESNDQLDEDAPEEEDEEEEIDGEGDEDEVDEDDDDGEEWLPGPSLESPGSVSAYGVTNRPSHVNYSMRNAPGGGPVAGAAGGSVTPKQELQQSDGKVSLRGGNDLHLKKVSC